MLDQPPAPRTSNKARGASTGVVMAVNTAAKTCPVLLALRFISGAAQRPAQNEAGPPSGVSGACQVAAGSVSLWTAKENTPFTWLLHITPTLFPWNAMTAEISFEAKPSAAAPTGKTSGVAHVRSSVVL